MEFLGIDFFPIRFDWTGPGNFKFANQLSNNFLPDIKTTSFQTFYSLIDEPGNINFTTPAGHNVSGQASFWRPVLSILLHTTGDLLSTIFGSPAQVDFFSEIEQLGPNSFQYTYTVTNYTSTTVDFDWTAAGISGTVNPDSDPNDPNDNVFVYSFMSPMAGIEEIGTALAVLSSDVITIQAHAFQPVPEPGTITCVLILGSLLVTHRRRRA